MKKSILTKNQKIIKTYYGKEHTLQVKIRYDDECNNGHNTFSITGDLYINKELDRCGCLHDEIEYYAPELSKYIKWHLMTSEEPLYYIENTLYHSRTREDMSKELNEPTRFSQRLKFLNYPFTFEEQTEGFWDFLLNKRNRLNNMFGFHEIEIEEVIHPDTTIKYYPHYSFKGFKIKESLSLHPWYYAPFRSLEGAKEFLEALRMSDFKIINIPIKWNKKVEPNLEAARRCAIWEDATLEQLQDKEALMARLPMLMEEFIKDIEELGFTY